MTTTLSLAGSSSDPTTRRALTNLSLGVAKSKKIVVVTGAGISCSCGIPDFRSSDGLYNLVKQQYPDVVLKGRDLFDASLFRDATSTAVFYTFISKLKQSIDTVEPSPTHHFLKTLDTKGKLLRSYTQNIDGLEERVGLVGSASAQARNSSPSKKGRSKMNLREVKNVQLHGDIRRVRCTLCSADYSFSDEHMSQFLEGNAPDCPDCSTRSKERVARSARALKVGSLRPGIVLYDEAHPLGDDIGSIETADLSRKPDLLIIMGTSLKVHGLKKLVKEFAKAVHATTPSSSSSSSPTCFNSPKPSAAASARNAFKGKVIFVNKTPPPAGEWSGVIDYHVEGETDAWVARVLEDWHRLRPADWEIQTTLDLQDRFKACKDTALSNPVKAGKGGKKPRPVVSEQENIPPPTTSQLGAAFVPNSPTKQPPLSSSKRRQGVSHYSARAGESSPSKKSHTMSTETTTSVHESMPASERGLLFGASRAANGVSASTEKADVEVEVVIPVIAKGNTRTAKAKTSKTAAASRRVRSFKRERSESSLDGLEDGFGVASLADPVQVLA